MRRALLLTATVASALILSAGVAFAQSISCQGGSCEGTPEGDLMTGSPIDDSIFARGGADVVHARAGDDSVFGGPRADTLYGESGIDELFGGTGADTLYEGSNNEPDQWLGSTLCGGRGDDRLYGGRGPDRYQFGEQWGKDTVVGEAEDGPGDVVDFSMFGGQLDCAELSGWSDSDLTIDLPAGLAYETPAGPSGANTVSFVGTRIEEVSGGRFDDTIIGDELPNLIFGEAGADTINAGGGDDRIGLDFSNERGDDTINTGPGDDTVHTNHVTYDPLDPDSDTIDCGPGDQDTAVIDDSDTTKNCESVTVSNDPGD
jgi:Ca2+-binding RTX toxin-like protein